MVPWTSNWFIYSYLPHPFQFNAHKHPFLSYSMSASVSHVHHLQNVICAYSSDRCAASPHALRGSLAPRDVTLLSCGRGGRAGGGTCFAFSSTGGGTVWRTNLLLGDLEHKRHYAGLDSVCNWIKKRTLYLCVYPHTHTQICIFHGNLVRS